MSDDGHVLGAVAFSHAGEVFLDGDVEDPAEGVFDPPMRAHGLVGLFGEERARGDVIAVFAGTELFVLDERLDLDDGGDFWEAVFAREAPGSGDPVDAVGDGGATLLDAAVSLIAPDVCVEDLLGRVVEEALDLVMERGLIVLDGQEIAGLMIDDDLRDGGITGDGIDGDQRVGQSPGVGQAFQKQRDRFDFIRLLLDCFLP